jgi:orotate phosphoribosyltransferase
VSDASALSAFEKCGVLVRGSHLVYTSGRHGSEYVNKDALYPDPEVISGLCLSIAKHFEKHQIERVLAPALGGIILTQWTSYHLKKLTGQKVLAVFAEKAETPNGFTVKRGYEKLLSGRRTLIVEDILTTGGSVKKVIELAKSLGAQVVGTAALCNRGGITANEIGSPVLFSLTEFSLESFAPEECPLCRAGVPMNTSLGKGGK